MLVDDPVQYAGWLTRHRFDVQDHTICAHDPDCGPGGQIGTPAAPGGIIDMYLAGIIPAGFREGEDVTDVLLATPVPRGLISAGRMGALIAFEYGETGDGKAREQYGYCCPVSAVCCNQAAGRMSCRYALPPSCAICRSISFWRLMT